MRRIILAFVVLVSFWISSCAPSEPLPTPQVASVYSTSAAEPWLAALYDCAGTSLVLSRVGDASAADIVLRVGEPALLSSFAYQIDSEEILIVTQRQSPVQNLTLDESRALFSGFGDPSLQLWVYASGEDVQGVFDKFVMEGRTVAPSALLAVDPQQMSDTLVSEPNTVGILPRHWKAGDSREIFSVATVPVLLITQVEYQGPIKEMIACLQK